jgi:hypothetical protein
MRNDARPIGEGFRDKAEHDRQENVARPPDRRSPAERARRRNTPFVTNPEPADEESPSDASER